jgi:hypothetical protein
MNTVHRISGDPKLDKCRIYSAGIAAYNAGTRAVLRQPTYIEGL